MCVCAYDVINWVQVEREADALLRDLVELDARLRGTVVAEVCVCIYICNIYEYMSYV